jgi:RNA polymerase sigma factor (TIGR02999 family)
MADPDITSLLHEAREGGGDRDALLAAVYDRLRSLAEESLRRERPGHTLQPTALVHEAYLKLVDQNRVEWRGRTHFHAVAAEAMRRILVDHARARNRKKRGGGCRRVTLYDAFALTRDRGLDMIDLHDALERMRAIAGRAADVVEQRIFGGLEVDEVARMLDVTTRTVERDWKWAQAWLRRELSGGDAT